MKAKLLTAVLLLSITTAFAQANKPASGDFGLRYGVAFNGGFVQQFTFSRFVKQNLECGAGVTFYYSHSKSTSEENLAPIYTLDGLSPATQKKTFLFTQFNVGINPFLVYHFPTKNNLDIYAGGGASFSIWQTNKDQVTTSILATNYENKEVRNTKSPLTFGGGLNAILGCQFFFYKNLAIGAQGGLGFNLQGTAGKSNTETTTTNSGSAHPSPGITTVAGLIERSSTGMSIGLNGNVGMNLTFYFGRKEKVKKDAGV